MMYLPTLSLPELSARGPGDYQLARGRSDVSLLSPPPGGYYTQDMVTLPNGQSVNRQQLANMGLGQSPMATAPIAPMPPPPQLPMGAPGQVMTRAIPSYPQQPMAPPAGGIMGGGGMGGGMNLGLLLQILQPFLMQAFQQRFMGGAQPMGQMAPQPPQMPPQQPSQPQMATAPQPQAQAFPQAMQSILPTAFTQHYPSLLPTGLGRAPGPMPPAPPLPGAQTRMLTSRPPNAMPLPPQPAATLPTSWEQTGAAGAAGMPGMSY